MKVRVVGVDCATDDAKVGLATGQFDGQRLLVENAALCEQDKATATTISGWIEDGPNPVLIAIDAPLGWPEPMGRVLAAHVAGQPIDVARHDLFRRETDRHIQRTLGNTPLDVGADRIARTAHTALEMLGLVGKAHTDTGSFSLKPEPLGSIGHRGLSRRHPDCPRDPGTRLQETTPSRGATEDRAGGENRTRRRRHLRGRRTEPRCPRRRHLPARW